MRQKNQKIYRLSPMLLVLFCLSACEKVIDINLNNGQPAIVIEANVTNGQSLQRIKISQTKSFTQDNSNVPFSGAQVVINEEGGRAHNCIETAPGEYDSDFFIGKPDIKYTVTVKANNTTYTAQSTMPTPVNLDSVTVTELSFFNKKRKYVQVNFNDPKNIVNQYNYVLMVNDTIRNAYYVDSDRFNDGNKVTNTIFNTDPELKSGDRVTIDFQCIDANVYRYFFAISQINGNGGPPTSPSNPTSNFNNGALGYFSAHTSQKKTIVIK